MTRDEVLAEYRPIRAGIQRILKLAPTACRPADMRRAVKQVAPWAEEEDLQSDDAVNMLVDVALFEPNQRGRRAFDRFLVEKAGQLDPADLALAERMAAAWFRYSAWPGGMKPRGYGWRTGSTETAGSG